MTVHQRKGKQLQAISDIMGTEILRLEDPNGNAVKVTRNHTMGQIWFCVRTEAEGIDAEGWFSEGEARNAAKRMAA